MTSILDRITQQRLEKLERIRNSGINPYPNRYHRTHTTQQAIAVLKQQEDSGQTTAQAANVAGRITAIRKMGKASFLDIRDGTGKIQLLFHDIDKFGENQLQL